MREMTENEVIERLKRIQETLKRITPLPKGTIEDDGNPRQVGQYYLTVHEPTFPVGLPKDCRTDDPVSVVIMAANTMEVKGHPVHLVAPMILDSADAGPEDVILPRYILPYRPAVAVGSCFSILDDSLAECKGRFPDETTEGLLNYRAFLMGNQMVCPPVVTGPDYLDEKDIRYKFHEDLVERIDYLQSPVEWLYYE